MGVLDFILGLIAIVCLFIFGIGALGMKYQTAKITEENEKLREEIKRLKARKKVVKEEK